MTERILLPSPLLSNPESSQSVTAASAAGYKRCSDSGNTYEAYGRFKASVWQLSKDQQMYQTRLIIGAHMAKPTAIWTPNLPQSRTQSPANQVLVQELLLRCYECREQPAVQHQTCRLHGEHKCIVQMHMRLPNGSAAWVGVHFIISCLLHREK